MTYADFVHQHNLKMAAFESHGDIDLEHPMVNWDCVITMSGKDRSWHTSYGLGLGWIEKQVSGEWIPHHAHDVCVYVGQPSYYWGNRKFTFVSGFDGSSLYRRVIMLDPAKRNYSGYGKPENAYLVPNMRPAIPKVADVIQSLASDIANLPCTFGAWCDNLGYDPDSRKAYSIYEACLSAHEKALQCFGRAILDELVACEEVED